MGQTPQLNSMRQDAELAAIKGNSPNSTKQDKDASIDASTRYQFAKRAYGKTLDKKSAPPAAKADASPSTPSKPTASAPDSTPSSIPSYKKGGMVKKTGLAKLHAGEKVIPRNKVGAVTKAMRKTSGGKR